MGDLSPIKILVVVVIALVVLGPEKLPDMMRRAGKTWSDFRRFRDDMSSQVRDVIGEVPGLGELHDLPGLRSTFAGSLLAPPTTTAPAGTGSAGGEPTINPAVDLPLGPPDVTTTPGSPPRPPGPGRRRPSSGQPPPFVPDDPELN